MYAWARRKANNYDGPDEIGRLPNDVNFDNNQPNGILPNTSPLLDLANQIPNQVNILFQMLYVEYNFSVNIVSVVTY